MIAVLLTRGEDARHTSSRDQVGSSSALRVRGVISPALANLYMNRMLKGWRQTKRGEQFRAQIVNYADDFAILSRGKAKEALEWTRGVLERLELTLNEQKTSVRKAIGSASIFSDIHSDRTIVRGRDASISDTVRRRRAWPRSRRKWETCWCRAM